MIPTLHNLSLINHIDDICILNRAKTVCNRDCGTAFGYSVECFLDDLLGRGVEGRGGFVEESVGIIKLENALYFDRSARRRENMTDRILGSRIKARAMATRCF
jgi:hypothetical protein